LKRDFIAQKTCDGEPYLRSGTANSAVPPVEMTDFEWWMVWEKATSAKLGFHRIIV
jgi:hypothetical protein